MSTEVALAGGLSSAVSSNTSPGPSLPTSLPPTLTTHRPAIAPHPPPPPSPQPAARLSLGPVRMERRHVAAQTERVQGRTGPKRARVAVAARHDRQRPWTRASAVPSTLVHGRRHVFNVLEEVERNDAVAGTKRKQRDGAQARRHLSRGCGGTTLTRRQQTLRATTRTEYRHLTCLEEVEGRRSWRDATASPVSRKYREGTSPVSRMKRDEAGIFG